MKDWLKNNVVGIVFGVASCGAVIGSIAADIGKLIMVNPWLFLGWTVAVAALSASITYLVYKTKITNRLGISIEQAAERLEKNAERIADLEPLKKENERLRERNTDLDEKLAHEQALVKQMEKVDKSQKDEIEALKSTTASLQEQAESHENALKKSMTGHYEKDSKTFVLSNVIDSKKSDVPVSEEAELRDRLFHLPSEFKDILVTAVINECVTPDAEDYVAASSLEADGLLVPIDTGKKLSRTWKATPLAHRIVKRDDEKLWEALQDGVEETAEKRRRQRLDKLQRNFAELSFEQKEFAFMAWKHKGYDFDRDAASAYGYDSGMLLVEDIGCGEWRYTVKPEYEELFEERGDACFAAVIKRIKENIDNDTNE